MLATGLRKTWLAAFDYVVVDEFHHAAAASDRKLLDHFTPRFLLGLSATPDRSDGADLVAMCDDPEFFRCDLFEGIEAGRLAPLRYFGVPDAVDCAQSPWRSPQFDPAAREAALATEAHAGNALDQFKRHGDGPAIGFCCSTRHADFLARFFAAGGLRAVAAHSGPASAPRATLLDRLGRGEIAILFAVDMFNEGIDVPEIGTVMMLRPKSASAELEAQYRDFRLRNGTRLWAPSPLFIAAADGLRLRRDDASGQLGGMVAELCEWRQTLPATARAAADPAARWRQEPELWREYIPPLFGTSFSPGNWNAGIVRLDRDLVLLATLKKANMATGGHYDDGFLPPGRMLNGTEPGSRVHLLVRNGKLRGGKAAPFLYCGRPVFEGWDGENPITVTWRLPKEVPPHLRPSLGLGAEG